MARSVTISSGLFLRRGRAFAASPSPLHAERHGARSLTAMLVMVAAFGIVGGQLVRLANKGGAAPQLSMSAPIAASTSRPDLVDRNGRLLATDVELPSLYADPLLVVDRDEVAEKLRNIFPDLDTDALRQTLADRSRRFAWIRRGLSPELAQRVHDLGLPGLAFRQELRRAYPSGRLAGHVLGGVNVDNRAVAGIERHLDEQGLVDPVVTATTSGRAAVSLSIDLSVQHALEQELAEAVRTYRATGAGGLVLDVGTGEILASASLPLVDPAHPEKGLDAEFVDRVTGGTYELGSIFKLLTVAMALDDGKVTPETPIDVTKPLDAGRHTIKDLHPPGRPLSVAEVLIKSSNVGAGMLALEAGAGRQRGFLDALGLTTRMRTEAGPLADPLLPAQWGRAETITVSFGHGLAVSPLQFAAAAAAVVNGGTRIKPTFLKTGGAVQPGDRVVSAATSDALRSMMARNVTGPGGTGGRAAVEGYAVGGKTGTAEMAIKGRYDRNAVIASFLGAFPIDDPKYLTLVLLFEPERTSASAGEITAGHTAAPVSARLVGRIAPLLGLPPQSAKR